MKEMWTGIHHKNGDEIYEVRFKTNDFKSYKFVQDACREALDTNWTEDTPCLDKEEDKNNKYRWIKINDRVFDLKDNSIIEYNCPKCNEQYLFKPDEIDVYSCFCCECGYVVHYEKI
jgi:hypothetical protein